MSLIALFALCLLQNGGGQEPAPEQESVSMQELEKAAAAVTERFAELDKLLSGTVNGISDAVADPQAVPAEDVSLDAAANAAASLVADMEHLLEVLPAPPPGGGSGNPDPNKPPQSEPPSQPSDPNHDPEGNEEGKPKPQDGQNGQAPPPEMPLRSVLRDPRAGQWGNLPPRLQQAIDNASAEDLPLRYRRWLVEYHRHGQDG